MSSSSPPNSSENLEHNNPNNPSSSSSIVKLRKIPHIPIRQSQYTISENPECSDEDEDVNDDDAEEEEDDDDDDYSYNDEDPIIVEASALGLHHIRTRSDPSRLRFSSSSSSVRKPSNLGKTDLPSNKGKDAPKHSIPLLHAITLEPGHFLFCPLFFYVYICLIILKKLYEFLFLSYAFLLL